jgi:hypothetical protein
MIWISKSIVFRSAAANGPGSAIGAYLAVCTTRMSCKSQFFDAFSARMRGDFHRVAPAISVATPINVHIRSIQPLRRFFPATVTRYGKRVPWPPRYFAATTGGGEAEKSHAKRRYAARFLLLTIRKVSGRVCDEFLHAGCDASPAVT